MAKKCDLCGEKIETTFLGKILGTKIRNKYVCSVCQRKHSNELEKVLGFINQF